MLNIKFIKMKNATRKNAVALAPILFVVFLNLNGCKKEELPEKEQWAPQNFWALDSTSIFKKLTWNYYGPSFIDGFKIDRKEGNSPWVRDYASLSVDQRYWLDTNIITYPKTIYEYNIYAFKGSERSAIQSIATPSAFKAPKITSTELNDDESAAFISWEANYDFEPGFVIDRKTTGDNWTEGYAIIAPGNRSFVDSNLYRSDGLSYKIHAVYSGRQSERDSTTVHIHFETPTNPASQRTKINRFEMTWEHPDFDRIEGFRVKRKYADTEWQTIGETNTFHFDDTTFMMDNSVVYGIHAYKGKIESTPLIIYFNSKIPAPENVYYKINSLSSVSIHFDPGIEGLDGYTLKKRSGNDDWSVFTSVNPGITEVEDNTIFLESCSNSALIYRLIANYGQSESEPVDTKVLFGAIIDQRDGQYYETIVIGNQCWLRENLNYQTANSWCYYSISTNCDIFGRLYAWQSALTACPSGWRLPTKNDWTLLINFCGGDNIAGQKLKDKGYKYWSHSANTPQGTDDYHFSALPGGYRGIQSLSLYDEARWWTPNNTWAPWYYSISYNSNSIFSSQTNKEYGLSVRCIKN